VVTLAAQRQAVELLKSRRISERRSCSLMRINRKSHRYRSHRKTDKELEQEIQEIARKYPSYGYRRVWAKLRRRGEVINRKKVWRLWQKLGLQVPPRKPRKPRRKAKCGVLPKAEKVNQIWTYDFVFDQSLSGKRMKMLTLVDEYTRECLAVEVGMSMKAEKVKEVLERVCRERGKPEQIRSDNGSEFISQKVEKFLQEKGIKAIYIEAGKPWQNGKGESFNGKLREECLRREWFSSVKEAQIVIEEWRKYYNQERPHSSLEYLTPNEFKEKADKEKKLAIHLE
jgi:putative transposase